MKDIEKVIDRLLGEVARPWRGGEEGPERPSRGGKRPRSGGTKPSSLSISLPKNFYFVYDSKGNPTAVVLPDGIPSLGVKPGTYRVEVDPASGQLRLKGRTSRKGKP